MSALKRIYNLLRVKKVIVGDPGVEGSGINIGGVVYDSTLKVSDIDGTNYAQNIVHRHSTTLEPLILGARSNSDTSAHADLTAGQNVFSFYGAGYAGLNYKLFASMTFGADTTGTISNTSAPGRIIRSVTPDGSILPVAFETVNNKGNVLYAATQSVTPITLTSSSNTVTVDASGSNNFVHTLTENTTIGAPSNLVNGTAYNFLFVQDSVTARTLAFNAVFLFADGVTPVISSNLGSVLLVSCLYTTVGGLVCVSSQNFS